ncbi:MAG: PepSY domain-containing protein [Gammaproteobacteria bacterium]|nr:PepSY domain-containing protein [Gammaproteobacteria bacterium]
MKPIVWMRKTHKWLGLLVGFQVFCWVLGGVVMSVLPLDKVHGDHLHHTLKPKALTEHDHQRAFNLISQHAPQTHHIRVFSIFQRKYVEFSNADNDLIIYDLDRGAPAIELSNDEVIANAQAIYTGADRIPTVERVIQHSTEYKKKLPAWRVTFDDDVNTTYYFDTQTGSLQSVRSSLWRVFDFFWMLHIMDYSERENFNNPLLITAAIIALLFVFSGFYLIVKVFHRRDFNWLLLRRKTKG